MAPLMYETINPFTEELIESFGEHSAEATEFGGPRSTLDSKIKSLNINTHWSKHASRFLLAKNAELSVISEKSASFHRLI